jgi:hypothetical protein
MVRERIRRGAVAHALRSAIGFLCERCGEDRINEFGCWRDFDFYVGQSDEWVTAFTAAALAETCDHQARDIAALVWSRLQARASGTGPGFGYNGKTTHDADSTIWACRLAQNLGISSGDCLSQSLDFIRSCMRTDGGISTFPNASVVRQMVRIPAGMSVEGWIQSHICVTAAAAGLLELGGSSVRRYLRATQSPSGAWSAYWWSDPEYATALAVDALRTSQSEEDSAAIERAGAWMASRADTGAPFPLALRVLGISRAGNRGFDAALGRLLDLQRADGSWPPSARLRQPPPYLLDPDAWWFWDQRHKGFGCVRVDDRSVFTTATAVWALAACTRI